MLRDHQCPTGDAEPTDLSKCLEACLAEALGHRMPQKVTCLHVQCVLNVLCATSSTTQAHVCCSPTCTISCSLAVACALCILCTSGSADGQGPYTYAYPDGALIGSSSAHKASFRNKVLKLQQAIPQCMLPRWALPERAIIADTEEQLGKRGCNANRPGIAQALPFLTRTDRPTELVTECCALASFAWAGPANQQTSRLT